MQLMTELQDIVKKFDDECNIVNPFLEAGDQANSDVGSDDYALLQGIDAMKAAILNGNINVDKKGQITLLEPNPLDKVRTLSGDLSSLMPTLLSMQTPFTMSASALSQAPMSTREKQFCAPLLSSHRVKKPPKKYDSHGNGSGQAGE